MLDLGLLLATTLAPWPTALIGAGLLQGLDQQRAAVLVYSIITVLVGLAWTLLQRHLAAHPVMLRSPGDVRWMRRNARYSLGTVAVGIAGASIALAAPLLAVILYLIVPSVFIALTLRDRTEERAAG